MQFTVNADIKCGQIFVDRGITIIMSNDFGWEKENRFTLIKVIKLLSEDQISAL